MDKLWILLLLPLGGGLLGWLLRWLYAKFQLMSVERSIERMRRDVVKDVDRQKKEIILHARESMQQEREDQEQQFRSVWQNIQRQEKKILQREAAVDEQLQTLQRRQEGIESQEKRVARLQESLQEKIELWGERVKSIAGLTREEAKKLLLQSVEDEANREARSTVNKIEQEALEEAEKRARKVLVSTMQRLASEISSENTLTTVPLPNEDMKGRIIGKEGRNIRALEVVTGVDVIIDETSEMVMLSCFDPVRREIARRTLTQLVSDGRIHPTRIEEVVEKENKAMQQNMLETGERVLFDLGIQHVKPEGVRAVGRMQYRSSYGQNLLAHSKEVAVLAGMIANELNADPAIAKRGAIFHDVGKSIDTEWESSHVELGVELTQRIGENEKVINCVAAHHGDVPHSCIESVIVQIADSISASRPGARKESLENYIRRLRSLEEIASECAGVDKAYAIQAGRELRVLVDNLRVNDIEARELARTIAKRVEAQLQYAGRIKITMIRETRIIEYAR